MTSQVFAISWGLGASYVAYNRCKGYWREPTLREELRRYLREVTHVFSTYQRHSIPTSAIQYLPPPFNTYLRHSKSVASDEIQLVTDIRTDIVLYLSIKTLLISICLLG